MVMICHEKVLGDVSVKELKNPGGVNMKIYHTVVYQKLKCRRVLIHLGYYSGK